MEDRYELYDIWKKYYKDEIPLFPDFFDKYLCAFVVEQEGHIVVGGGVRTIAESVILTNKSFTPRQRVVALREVLHASKYVANRSGYNNLNAFIADESWKKHLIRIGFKPEMILQLEL